MSLFTTLVGGKLLISALAVGSVAVGGTAAAAATGELPTALQQQAHSVFGAPAPQVEASTGAEPDATETDSQDPTDTESQDPTDTESQDPTDTQSQDPTGTQATGPSTTDVAPVAPAVPASAHGLCTAWSKGGLAVTSVAYTTLVTAAGGSAADLPAWCAPHLVAPGHAKHQSGSDGTTADSSEPTTTHSSHRGHGHSHVSDSTATDDQQGDDSASQPQGSTSETQDSSSDDQQGDDSNDVSGSDSGSHHGGHGSDDSSGSDD